MATICHHIHFNGNAEEAFEFYRSVFGGSVTQIVRYRDLWSETQHFSESELNKIMRISLPVGTAGMLMGSDVPDVLGKVSEREHRSKIVVQAETKEEADRLFIDLSAAGEVEFPMDRSPWGSYFGALRDKYGVEWMVEHLEHQNSKD